MEPLLTHQAVVAVVLGQLAQHLVHPTLVLVVLAYHHQSMGLLHIVRVEVVVTLIVEQCLVLVVLAVVVQVVQEQQTLEVVQVQALLTQTTLVVQVL
jgi:hypothetical protein